MNSCSCANSSLCDEEEKKTCEESEKKLSVSQQKALQLALDGKNVFITGSAGVGKSLLIERIVRQFEKLSKNIAITATTGRAAVNINGTTLHFYAGIGIAEESLKMLLRKAETSQKIHDAWNNLDVLIVDEISMLSPDYLAKLEAIVKYTRNCDKPFGGIQVIFVGDFFQLPPVSKDSSTTKPTFCFELTLWNKIIQHTIHLTEVFRQEDNKFVNLLNRLRVGKPSTEDILLLQQRVNAPLYLPPGIEVTQLRSKLVEVDAINFREQANCPLPEHTFQGNWGYAFAKKKIFANGKVLEKESVFQKLSNRQEKLISHLVEQCPAISQLNLRIGSQVMLVVNLDISRGLVNGSKGVVTSVEEIMDPNTLFKVKVPNVLFTNGRKEIIERHRWTVRDKKLGEAWYVQIPLRLAFATSIHRVQGCTLEFVSTSLDRSIFAEGQGYVAVSRVKSLDRLTLTSFDPKIFNAHWKVVKFYELLNP